MQPQHKTGINHKLPPTPKPKLPAFTIFAKTTTMTRRQLFRQFTQALSQLYPAPEAESLGGLALRHAAQTDTLQWHLGYDQDPGEAELIRANQILQRLLQHEPLQYITGETWFCGLRFSVNPSVLIPRPETEMLTDRIISENKNTPNLVIADIGTGSGCIAISMAKLLPQSRVHAFDLSEAALSTARSNAIAQGVEVNFYTLDILRDSLSKHLSTAGIIVSNPPYVLESDKPAMLPNVLSYEPHEALFVPDNNPLLFYHAIASQAFQILRSGGRLYFEIHETQGQNLIEMLHQMGYTNILLSPDFNNKHRFISASK